MDKKARMEELIKVLNEASEAYYALDNEIMSNYEYDKLYDELVALEEELGVTLSNSPTINVGYEAVKNLPKEAHEKPMLSLSKTKSRDELKAFLGGQKGILSWKLDGLTIVLTYKDGELFKAVTRGNGEVGEVITQNAKVFKNIPPVEIEDFDVKHIEKSLIDAVSKNRDKLLYTKLNTGDLGIFGMTHNFEFYGQGYGYLVAYARELRKAI